MCAIFGFIGQKDQQPKLSALREIVESNMPRGPHAFGFSWIDAAGRLRMYKQTGRLVDSIGMLAMARDAQMLVGHLRWATHGDPRNNLNNHPHPVDGGWLVHNGIVANYARLVRTRKLWPVTDCDSEAIGLLVEASIGTLAQRCRRAIRMTEGPLAMLGLWSRPTTLIAARRGNPLHIGETREGMYLATVADGLPGRVRSMADNRIHQASLRKGELAITSVPLPSPARQAEREFQPSLYCGG